LTLRFGPLVCRRLDQAFGRAAEPIEPVRPPDVVEVRRVFAEPIAAPETIHRYLGKLVVLLCAALEAEVTDTVRTPIANETRTTILRCIGG
jgi:protein ImuB